MKKVITILLTICTLLLVGCGNKYSDGFTEGYSAGYEAGYQAALSDNKDKIAEYKDQISNYESQMVKEESKTYILNTNSKKFHLPTCSSVSKIKESNKVERICTRSELIEDGYSPCQSCKP